VALKAFGGGIFAQKDNGDYDADKVIVNSAESIKGGEQLAKMGKDKVLSTNVGDDNARPGIFTAGKAPFFITGPWAIPKGEEGRHQLRHLALPTCPAASR
jgi:arabinogalactan oligomer/maltooligosaccharide transport system substrate-binding protein